jgi:hypothetical protein
MIAQATDLFRRFYPQVGMQLSCGEAKTLGDRRRMSSSEVGFHTQLKGLLIVRVNGLDLFDKREGLVPAATAKQVFRLLLQRSGSTLRPSMSLPSKPLVKVWADIVEVLKRPFETAPFIS